MKIQKLAGNLKLTQDAQKSFDFSIEAYRHGLCTPYELVEGLKSIIRDEINKQSDFLIEQGFTASGAWNHIWNLDKEEVIL